MLASRAAPAHRSSTGSAPGAGVPRRSRRRVARAGHPAVCTRGSTCSIATRSRTGCPVRRRAADTPVRRHTHDKPTDAVPPKSDRSPSRLDLKDVRRLLDITRGTRWEAIYALGLACGGARFLVRPGRTSTSRLRSCGSGGPVRSSAAVGADQFSRRQTRGDLPDLCRCPRGRRGPGDLHRAGSAGGRRRTGRAAAHVEVARPALRARRHQRAAVPMQIHRSRRVELAITRYASTAA